MRKSFPTKNKAKLQKNHKTVLTNIFPSSNLGIVP